GSRRSASWFPPPPPRRSHARAPKRTPIPGGRVPPRWHATVASFGSAGCDGSDKDTPRGSVGFGTTDLRGFAAAAARRRRAEGDPEHPMKRAKLILDGKEFALAVTTGTEGENAIDTTKLRDLTGCVTLDPGYGNTGSCLSAVTFIDGEKGILRYRGYP